MPERKSTKKAKNLETKIRVRVRVHGAISLFVRRLQCRQEQRERESSEIWVFLKEARSFNLELKSSSGNRGDGPICCCKVVGLTKGRSWCCRTSRSWGRHGMAEWSRFVSPKPLSLCILGYSSRSFPSSFWSLDSREEHRELPVSLARQRAAKNVLELLKP